MFGGGYILNIVNLSVGYSKPVLSDISFEVKKGEIIGILGPNGSGKSTLLRTLATNLKPIKGAVFIEKYDIFKFSPKDLARKMSVMLTDKVDCGFLTGFEVVSLGRYPYINAFGRLREKDIEVVEECLRIVNAENLSNRLFFEMSDGERQKILIARALAQEPEVMLMDEPTSFLDAKHKIEIMLLLRKIATEKSVAIVLTTHDVELALRVCDKVILLRGGRIIAEGPPEDVLTPEILRDVYGVDYAKFESSLGSFEIQNSNSKIDVHVVCGGGSGANVMRFLSKKGVGFSVGVIHANDVDFVVARNLSSEVIFEKPYRKISRNKIKEVINLIAGKTVIDTGFPIGEMNELNLEILRAADRVLSFRCKDELEEFGIDTECIKNFKELEEVLL